MSTGTTSRAGTTGRLAGTLYRGREGMWSWVLHRITGVLTFFFLFAHVLDTALVRVSPQSYDSVIATYKNPVVNLLELGLVGAVLFHALNGLRIIAVDFWGRGPRLQRQMLWLIVAVWVVVMVPGAFFMLKHSVDLIFGSEPDDRYRSSPLTAAPTARRTNTELYAWLFMRVSGVLLVVLVLGHLFIMNILDGGVQRINFGFVAGRWASPFWQVWDLLMLWLAQLHGTNGLRTHQRLHPLGRHQVLAEDGALHRLDAGDRARHPGDLHLRPEHLLAGHLSTEHRPAQVFAELGIALQRHNYDVVIVGAGAPACGPPWNPPAEPGPRCSRSSTRPARTPAPPRAACAPRWPTSRTTTGNGTPSTPSRAVTTWSTRTPRR